MQFQKTLLATAALAMLALPACAQTYKQTNDAELAGGKHHQSVKIIKLKDGVHSAHDMKTGVIELEGTAMAFLDGDGFGDMDVEVTRGENGEKIIVMNGEKITLKDGTHQWKNKDGKTIKLVMDKHNKKHSKHMKKIKMRLAGGEHEGMKNTKYMFVRSEDGTHSMPELKAGVVELHGMSMDFLEGGEFGDMDVEVTHGENGEKIIVMNGEKITLKDGTHQWKSKDGKTIKFVMDKHNKKHSKHMKKMKMLFADAEHSDTSIKELFARLEGHDGMVKTKIMFVGSEDGALGEGKFPRVISLDSGTQVLVEKNGDIKVMKDGKEIDTSQYGTNQMSVNKSITNENGKRKTRIVIELEDEQ